MISFTWGFDECTKTYKLIDGTFPAWRKVLPQKTKVLVGFDSKYLGQLCKVLERETLVLSAAVEKRVKGTKAKPMKMDEYFSNAPWSAHNDKGAKFVIMPRRI